MGLGSYHIMFFHFRNDGGVLPPLPSICHGLSWTGVPGMASYYQGIGGRLQPSLFLAYSTYYSLTITLSPIITLPSIYRAQLHTLTNRKT